MSNLLVAKIEALLLQEPLDTLCGATVVYLTIEDNTLPPYDKVREIVDRAVSSTLSKIDDIVRRTKVLEILPQMEGGYTSVRGLKALKVLNMDREAPPDHTQEEIQQNLSTLKYKLEHPLSEADVNLYGSLKQNLVNITASDLTWRDPEASMVLSDDSDIIKNLGRRQKSVFIEPRENMKSELPDSVVTQCDMFVEIFNNSRVPNITRNEFHNKKWKESETELVKVVERILGAL
ncbi:unnamed protein product [Rhizophagus irregularis]|nr:unnamed protein product [Rhizophagus irregularis]